MLLSSLSAFFVSFSSEDTFSLLHADKVKNKRKMDNKKIKFFIKKSPSCFKTNIYILKQMRGNFY
ncbi:hypothetical protein B4094_0066 [Bacillus licheniformis]|nr:hypothetical protein B4094_0066 [Bacillus licheniformis]